MVSVGHFGISFYFIVSGTVRLEREDKDDRTGQIHVLVSTSSLLVFSILLLPDFNRLFTGAAL